MIFHFHFCYLGWGGVFTNQVTAPSSIQNWECQMGSKLKKFQGVAEEGGAELRGGG
jgi:hypothetical protein